MFIAYGKWLPELFQEVTNQDYHCLSLTQVIKCAKLRAIQQNKAKAT